MKKLVFTLMTLLMPIMVCAYDFEKDGLYYNKNYTWDGNGQHEDGTVSLTFNNSSIYTGDLVIPDVVNYNGVDYPVTGLEPGCFSQIKSIELGKNIKEIPSCAFAYCRSLTTVVLNEGLKYIGEKSFCGCSNLILISLPYTVERIDDAAFYECTGLVSVKLPNQLQKLGKAIFEGCSNLNSINIPDNLTEIPVNFLAHCSSLQEIKLSDKITDLKDGCFGGSAIKTIEIPNSVKTIADQVFVNCKNLESIILPESLEKIGSSAFLNCFKLENVILPKYLKSIGLYAFYNCVNLKTISFPNSITLIDDGAFESSGLVSVKLPNNLEGVASSAFASCGSLKTVQIPEKVKTIYNQAFEGCSAIEEIYVNATTPPTLYDGSFSSFSATVYVPEGKISDYKNANNWSKFSNIQEINGTTKKYFVNARYDYGGTVELNDESIESGNVKDFSEGSSVTLKITPFENYVIRSVLLDGTDITSQLNDNEYIIDNIGKDYSLTVSFKELRASYNISLSRAVNNGTVTVNDEVLTRYNSISAATGSDVTLKIVADPGYQTVSVTVNGEFVLDKMTGDTYIIKGIDDDCIIDVVFTEKVQHQFITVSYYDAGYVLLNGKQIPSSKNWGFPTGDNVNMKIVSNDGFRIKYVSLKKGYGAIEEITYDINEDGEYTIEAIDDNVQISVEFENIPYYLNVESSNGIIVSIPVRSGQRQEVRIPIDESRKLSKVTYDGKDISSQIWKDGTFYTPIIEKDVNVLILYDGETRSADLNGDGVVNVADVVELVNIINAP